MSDLVEVNAADLRAVLGSLPDHPSSARARLHAALSAAEPWEPDEEVVRRYTKALFIEDADNTLSDAGSEVYARTQLRLLHDAGLDVVLREGES